MNVSRDSNLAFKHLHSVGKFKCVAAVLAFYWEGQDHDITSERLPRKTIKPIERFA
jgi:hypothetical protein